MDALNSEQSERQSDGETDPCEDIDEWRSGRADGDLILKHVDVVHFSDEVRLIVECPDESDDERADEIQEMQRGRDEEGAVTDFQFDLPFPVSLAGLVKVYLSFERVIC